MFDQDFNPYDALMQLNDNQQRLHQNQLNNDRSLENLNIRINNLTQLVNQQQAIIQSMITGLEQNNATQQMLMINLVKEIQTGLEAQGIKQ